jgi:chromosome segregation ATPase
MAQDPREVGAQRLEEDQDKSAEQLRAEIEDTREELGDTVEALAAKTDVKTRARDKADELKRNAQAKKDELISKAKQASPVGGGGDGNSSDATEGPPGITADRGDGGGVGSVVEQLKSKVQQNPVATAALAAFVGGVAFGRLISRP